MVAGGANPTFDSSTYYQQLLSQLGVGASNGYGMPVNPTGDASNAVGGASLEQLLSTLGGEANVQQYGLGQNIGYAREETGFQQQLLGLSEQSLGIEQSALQRQFPLAKWGHQMTTDQISRQQAQTDASTAASGARFSKGAQDTFAGYHEEKKNADIQYLAQVQALQDQQKQYQIQAQRYGISGQELQARLQNTIQNLQSGYNEGLFGLEQAGYGDIMNFAQSLQGAPVQSLYGAPNQSAATYSNWLSPSYLTINAQPS